MRSVTAFGSALLTYQVGEFNAKRLNDAHEIQGQILITTLGSTARWTTTTTRRGDASA